MLNKILKYASTFVVIFAYIGGAIIIVNQTKLLFGALKHPFAYIKTAADPATIHTYDKKISIRYIFERTYYCQTDLSVFIMRTENDKLTENVGEVVWRQRAPGGATGLGKSNIVTTFDISNISSPLIPGSYKFRTITYSVCPNGVFTDVSEDALFTVVP